MTIEPVNAICLGGPCHGLRLHVDRDSGVVLVPLPSHNSRITDYHVTGERARYLSCADPLTVLHWNHPLTSDHCRGI
jgi:hypothetical protein